MSSMPEISDRTRLLAVVFAVVIGLAVASVPLVASIFAQPETPPAASPTSESQGAQADQSAPNEALRVNNVVPCVQQEGEGLASDIEADAELAEVRLPCLTDGGKESSQSLAEQFAGKPTVVNVWAWWCGPCRQELPILQDVAENNPEWNVVGVHLDAKGQAGVDFLEELGVDNFPSYQDGNHVFDAATNIPKVVPVTLVYRPDGSRAETFVRTFDDSAQMQQLVSEALAK